MKLINMKIALAGIVVGIATALVGTASAQEVTLKLHHFLPPVAMAQAMERAAMAVRCRSAA